MEDLQNQLPSPYGVFLFFIIKRIICNRWWRGCRVTVPSWVFFIKRKDTNQWVKEMSLLPSPLGVFLFFIDSIGDVFVTLVIGKLPSPLGVFLFFMRKRKSITWFMWYSVTVPSWGFSFFHESLQKLKKIPKIRSYRPLLGFFFFSWIFQAILWSGCE